MTCHEIRFDSEEETPLIGIVQNGEGVIASWLC
jgi:hypothetical protein